MALILVIVFIYIRFAGSEALMGEEDADVRPRVAPACAKRDCADAIFADPGCHLPAAPDRGDHRVLASTTRPAATTSPGGFTLDALERTPVGIPELHRRLRERASRSALLGDPGRDRARHDDRVRPGPLPVPRPPRANLLIFLPMATPEVVHRRRAALAVPDLRDPARLRDAADRPRHVLHQLRGRRRHGRA